MGSYCSCFSGLRGSQPAGAVRQSPKDAVEEKKGAKILEANQQWEDGKKTANKACEGIAKLIEHNQNGECGRALIKGVTAAADLKSSRDSFGKAMTLTGDVVGLSKEQQQDVSDKVHEGSAALARTVGNTVKDVLPDEVPMLAGAVAGGIAAAINDDETRKEVGGLDESTAPPTVPGSEASESKRPSEASRSNGQKEDFTNACEDWQQQEGRDAWRENSWQSWDDNAWHKGQGSWGEPSEHHTGWYEPSQHPSWHSEASQRSETSSLSLEAVKEGSKLLCKFGTQVLKASIPLRGSGTAEEKAAATEDMVCGVREFTSQTIELIQKKESWEKKEVIDGLQRPFQQASQSGWRPSPRPSRPTGSWHQSQWQSGSWYEPASSASQSSWMEVGSSEHGKGSRSNDHEKIMPQVQRLQAEPNPEPIPEPTPMDGQVDRCHEVCQLESLSPSAPPMACELPRKLPVD